ncbi:TlyA family RNA methyltransferase [Sanguibacter sp. 25GB23B1]|uniref:TlyA family RNA methyltransferase n=1 Tax=unclassified Sanguibacter TaxID=2645534 RepID=UPI0032AFA97D
MTGASPSDPEPPEHASSRIDAALVRRGLARSRGHAVRLLTDGLVLVDGRRVSKASAVVTGAADLRVSSAVEDTDYVSRAAFKLRGALDALGALGPGVDGTDCLDVGASTGGFTQLLLERGARRVVALDVGHDQLAASLRADARVHVIEGCNARALTGEDLPWQPRLVVADVSFISLTLVVPPVLGAVEGDIDLLVMVKPQFEVGRERLGSGGVVRDPALHAESVRAVVAAAHAAGAQARAVIPSPLPGPHGNREFFVWFTRAEPHAETIDDTIERAVRDVPHGDTPAAHWVGTDPPRTGGRP